MSGARRKLNETGVETLAGAVTKIDIPWFPRRRKDPRNPGRDGRPSQTWGDHAAAVDDGRPDLKQMNAAWRPPHLLPGLLPAMQQPLHGALRWRRGERLVIQARGRVIDDQIGEAGHVGLQRDQCLRQLRRRSGRRGFLSRLRLDSHQGALDQAERPRGLAMPKASADVFDRIGEPCAVPVGAGRGVRPAACALSGVLDAPVSPGGTSPVHERDGSGPPEIAGRPHRRSGSSPPYPPSCRGPVSTPCRQHLERSAVVATRRPDMLGVDRHRDRFRRRRRIV